MEKTLAERMGINSPVNHITLDSEEKRKTAWGMESEWKNFTIRQICCKFCEKMLFSVVSEDIYNADLVFPFRVVCHPDSVQHELVPRFSGEDANAICKGRAVTEKEAALFLKKYA